MFTLFNLTFIDVEPRKVNVGQKTKIMIPSQTSLYVIPIGTLDFKSSKALVRQ